MSAPGPTMKSMIQKRIYTVLPRLPPHAPPGPSSPPLPPLSKRPPRRRSHSLSTPSPSSSSAALPSSSSSASSSRTLYTAPPSSGPLAFFDAPPPPPPSSRPGNPHVLPTSRLPVKGEGEGHSSHSHSHPTTNGTPHTHGQNSANLGGQPPFSLALTAPQTNASLPHAPPAFQPAALFPYSSLGPVPFYSIAQPDHPDAHPRIKRHQPRYHLDVGAYGIPKRSNGKTSAGRDGFTSNPSSQPQRSSGNVFHDRSAEDLGLAVQVGEDAYFIRDNAMGVADGVGGWARSRPDCARSSSNDPSPSALFARRLMHYCSAETSAAQQRASDATLLSRSAPEHSHMRPAHANGAFSVWPWSSPVEQMQDELEDELEDLEDGLDVLMILERAYESTIKAHVVPSTPTSSGSSSPPTSSPIQGSPEPHLSAAQSMPPPTTPLKTGSSTALVAVLQHSPRPKQESDAPRFTLFPPTTQQDAPTHDAVLKIAHLGDCMGMLVRGEQVAWRSEEMWWGFNAPVQLGPSSNARPADAQIITLPVQQDDILILASDGLSDNLWDFEVLDEVVRFKRSFLRPSPSPSSKSGALDESRTQGLLGRRTLAGMLSEALCSRARRVSERKGPLGSSMRAVSATKEAEAEVPFARRAREQGKVFHGGKIDDISVLVAVISPAEDSVVA